MLKKLGLHRVRLALSSGAPLPAEVQALWQVWGVNLKNLYGQTESGVVTAQFEPFPQPGTVGRPYPGNEIALGPTTRSSAVSPGSFSGYWAGRGCDRRDAAPGRHPHRRRRHGRCDGVLQIVDRKKDIVITAGGKNLSPSRIETTLKSSPYISEANVIGEGPQVSHCADRDRRRHRVGVGARPRRDLFDLSFARHQHRGHRISHARSSRPTRALGRVEQVRNRGLSRSRSRVVAHMPESG